MFAASVLTLAAVFPIKGIAVVEESDSVYLFSYSKHNGKSGLRFARSKDKQIWESLSVDGEGGEGYDFVSSDFGPWGSHKKMFAPRLFRTKNGEWVACWYVSDKFETMATARSSNLINWEPQKYATKEDSSALGLSGLESGVPAEIRLNGKSLKGEIIKVPAKVIFNLELYLSDRRIKRADEAELMADDKDRFKGLSAVTATVCVDASTKPKSISDNLIGIFFEDISYAADGGIYAEMVQNRDFEYRPDECNKKGWGSTYSWRLVDKGGNNVKMNICDEQPLHVNNSRYLRIAGNNPTLYLENVGYDGMSVKGGAQYKFTLFARNSGETKKEKIKIRLIASDGTILGTGSINISGNGWKKYQTKIDVNKSDKNSILQIEIPSRSAIDLDMISLFPTDTYGNRENGLRKEMVEVLKELQPKFVRFPGGCVAHGDGIDNIYDWKGSIGSLESRKPLRNIWNYHQTRGLGYHEYFLLCEDLGATPLPVLASGVPCQNSGRAHSHSHNEITSLGQQCGIPMADMDAYVQDVLDLIEYANGDVNTEWGAKRAAAGHPEPFNLRYLGIGNEDMITEVFEERFKYIHDKLKTEHPEITIVGTVGPFFEGSDYDEGWKFAKREKVSMVDEHYYVSPGWYLNHRDFYDKYDRQGPKVYLGEYASHLHSRKNTLETALTVALYLTDVERNGDVVEMTSYAPLFAKDRHVNWRPDLIFFNNDEIRLTPDYYVQKLYGNNSGSEYYAATVKLSDSSADVAKRVGHSLVRDAETGDFIIKIANLLPVEMDFTEDLSHVGIASAECKATVLVGNPDDECTKPQEKSVSISGGKLVLKVEPYSFNVVRIKAPF